MVRNEQSAERMCNCGCKSSWKTDRLCSIHRYELHDRFTIKQKTVIINGMEVPVSPDGIPMLHWAKPMAKPVSDEGLDDIAGRVFTTLHPGAEYLRK